jgi:hypothetical protein
MRSSVVSVGPSIIGSDPRDAVSARRLHMPSPSSNLPKSLALRFPVLRPMGSVSAAGIPIFVALGTAATYQLPVMFRFC